MLAMAALGGTTDIVATPHADLRFRYDDVAVGAWIGKLTSTEYPRIHRGCDFHLSYDNVRAALARPSQFSINGKGYLLVEFPDHRVEATTATVLATLRKAGLTPVITHPERNNILRDRPHDLGRWVQEGCLVQITGASLLGDFGGAARRFCEHLLHEGLVHFVASDAHGVKHRTTDLRPAVNAVRKRWGEFAVHALFFENGRHALDGDPVKRPRTRKSFAWFGAFRAKVGGA